MQCWSQYLTVKSLDVKYVNSKGVYIQLSVQKSRIRETPILLTKADSRTNTFPPSVFHQEIAEDERVLIKETEFWWPSGTRFFSGSGYGLLQSSHQGDHQEIASYGAGYEPLQSFDRPMRSRDLTMWSEGHWEALKNIAWGGNIQDTRYIQDTDIATTRPNQPSGPIWWKLWQLKNECWKGWSLTNNKGIELALVGFITKGANPSSSTL